MGYFSKSIRTVKHVYALADTLRIFNFGAALSAAFLVDRLGRRTLFTWSGIGMLISYIVWTACSAVNAQTGSTSAGIVVIVCLFTFFFHYDIGKASRSRD